MSQIVEELGASQTNVSRHLGIMHRSGVLARRKQGNVVYYRTADAAMVDLCRTVCKRISEHMEEKMPLRGELLRLMPQPKAKAEVEAARDLMIDVHGAPCQAAWLPRQDLSPNCDCPPENCG